MSCDILIPFRQTDINDSVVKGTSVTCGSETGRSAVGLKAPARLPLRAVAVAQFQTCRHRLPAGGLQANADTELADPRSTGKGRTVAGPSGYT